MYNDSLMPGPTLGSPGLDLRLPVVVAPVAPGPSWRRLRSWAVARPGAARALDQLQLRSHSRVHLHSAVNDGGRGNQHYRYGCVNYAPPFVLVDDYDKQAGMEWDSVCLQYSHQRSIGNALTGLQPRLN